MFLPCLQAFSAYEYKKFPLAVKSKLYCFNCLTFLKSSSHAKYPPGISRDRKYVISSIASPHPLDICHLLGILFSNMSSLWELCQPLTAHPSLFWSCWVLHRSGVNAPSLLMREMLNPWAEQGTKYHVILPLLPLCSESLLSKSI